MNAMPPISPPVLALQPGATQAEDDGYEAVTGLDAETTRLKREYEAQVEQKVASDYAHIVWAYGVIWTLFAAYGAFLLLRVVRQQRDLEELRRQLRGEGG